MTTIFFDKLGELYLVKRGFGLWHKKHINKIHVPDLNVYRDCDIRLKKDDIIMFLGFEEDKLHFLCNNKIAFDRTCANFNTYLGFVEKL